jgi:hypothetical protein
MTSRVGVAIERLPWAICFDSRSGVRSSLQRARKAVQGSKMSSNVTKMVPEHAVSQALRGQLPMPGNHDVGMLRLASRSWESHHNMERRGKFQGRI